MAFWNARSGLLVSTVTTLACLAGGSACPGGLIERTADGAAGGGSSTASASR